jgi:bifunctional non-homologous end joining protein LigD
VITHIGPMFAEAADDLPRGAGWVHEPKYDGIRIEGHTGASGVALFTRSGHNKVRQFPEVAEAFRALYRLLRQDVVLDGELVASTSDGFTGFQLLQRRVPLENDFQAKLLSRSIPATFVGFDVLTVAGRSVRGLPLSERRQVLETALSKPPPGLRLGVQETDGPAMLELARREGWEGIVSKRALSAYVPGQRGPSWRKLKITVRQEFVVAGFTASESERREFGALVVGYYVGERLVYAGRVGTGFSQQELAQIAGRLRAIRRINCPFAEPPTLEEPASWVDPALVVEVLFNGWTETERLRWPRFLALREDKRPEEVVRET